MKNLISLLICLGGMFSMFAQVDQQASSSDIYEALLKLNNTATVMYVAAHPDDENTRMISWLSNHMHVNTVYLSLTRGDGGQNLIGTEKGQLLGLLRTQELLQARSIDGGKQFFSRANDFGYSKTATETREIWEEDEIMSDVVWAIRKHQPDILINRFDHNSNGKTHGHHTFSAIASMEAFDLAGQPNQFTQHLSLVEPWQPKRIFFNTSWWFYGSHEKFEKADKSKMVAIDIGEYYPILGTSNNEIAAQSRSMHKCQGFGSAATRGSQMEYLQFLKGDAPAMTQGQMTDIFEGIDMTWNRVEGGDIIDQKLNSIITTFDFAKPSKSVPDLIDLLTRIRLLDDDQVLIDRKINELKDIIKWCSALYLEATTSIGTAAQTDSVNINFEYINRSKQLIKLNSINILPINQSIVINNTLAFNQANKTTSKILIPSNLSITSPYWLVEKQDKIGMYKVEDPTLIGLPETPRELRVAFEMEIEGVPLTYIEDIQHKFTDPAIGELYEPFVVGPPITVSLQEPVYLLANQQPDKIQVEVRSQTENVKGQVNISIAPGWKIDPLQHDFSITKKGDRRVFSFTVTPPEEEQVTTIRAMAQIGNQEYSQSFATVNYDHLPMQTLFRPAEAIIEHLNITIPSMRIGYISGAGDEIPRSLRQLGIIVDEINLATTNLSELQSYHTVVLGIRAFNTKDELVYVSDDLWKYVEQGGTVIVQYNTAHRLKTEVSPIPLKLGRERITEEDAELTILEQDHIIFNYPNKINSKDFEGWVQERGLYFASEWDDSFTPMLSGHDKGETDKKGMLLIAPYGKGHYVYTGLSFFRELPAGVPGAYRLFINLLALQNEKP